MDVSAGSDGCGDLGLGWEPAAGRAVAPGLYQVGPRLQVPCNQEKREEVPHAVALQVQITAYRYMDRRPLTYIGVVTVPTGTWKVDQWRCPFTICLGYISPTQYFCSISFCIYFFVANQIEPRFARADSPAVELCSTHLPVKRGLSAQASKDVLLRGRCRTRIMGKGGGVPSTFAAPRTGT